MAGTNVVIFEMEIKIRVRICKIYWGKGSSGFANELGREMQ